MVFNTISPVKATTAHFYIDEFLASNSIPRNEVEIVFMNKQKRPQAIAKGKFGGFFVSTLWRDEGIVRTDIKRQEEADMHFEQMRLF